MEKEKEERKKEVEKEKEERKKELEEEGRRWKEAMEGGRSNRGGGSLARNESEEQQQPYVLLVDSNGRGATPDSIRNHIPREERQKYGNIKVHTAYTTDEALRRVGDNDIDVRNAIVVLDNLTNDVRGTRQRMAASPAELVQRVDRLRRRLQAAGAAAVVVCELKPMEICDVRPHAKAVHDYLRSVGNGYGCPTQIRRDFLQRDGFHIQPQYDSILDRTYACAMRGVPVPCPTPVGDFAPMFARRRYDLNFPRLPGAETKWDQMGGSEGPLRVHGWGW